MFEQQSMGERPHTSGGRRAFNRKRPAECAQQFRKELAPGCAYAPVPIPETCMRLGMPQGKELEFQGNQDQAAVRGIFRVVFPQRRKFFERIFMPAESRSDGIDSFLDPLLQQGKEDVFLALKIGVKSAARVARAGGNIFQASRLETVLCEDAFGGGQQLSLGGRSSFHLAGAGPRYVLSIASGLQ